MDRRVVRKIAQLKSTDPAVLCSVVRFDGSVPRKDYPLMLVLPNGESIGTIGGGKLEYETIEAAKGMGVNDEALLLSFDLTNADLSTDEGLCGGHLTVLMEALGPDLKALFKEIEERLDSNSTDVLQLEFYMGETISPQRRFQTPKQGSTEDVGSSTGAVLLEYPLHSVPRLHVFGAGHVGAAVARLAVEVELETFIYDDREELLTAERLPGVLRIPLQEPESWETSPYARADYVVLASRSHRHDHALLAQILKDPPAYIGALASKRKWALMKADMLERGYDPTLVENVHAPVGMGINSETVPEIAVSIMAQIIAHYRGAQQT